MDAHPTELLSEYLDDELEPAGRARVQAHLAHCQECRDTLEELRRVVARAQALDDQAVSRELWPGIAALIGAGPIVTRRRWSFSMPQLIAAGIALMLLSGGSVAWWLKGQGQGPGTPPAPATMAASVTPRLAAAADSEYRTAVVDLERILRTERSRLDSATVRVLEEKLAIIDRAITEAEQALLADPRNPYLSGHLAQTRLRKLDLLRRAVHLAGAAS